MQTYLTLLSAFFLLSCAGQQSEKKDNAPTSAPATNSESVTPAAAPAGPENTAHYICPDRCKGSGSDSPGKCPVCGKDYIHNDAFHQNTNTQQQSVSVSPNPSSPPNQLTIDNTSKQNPDIEALKKKGPEYLAHYVCPSYCKGSGSAEMGKCPVCGKDYVHNDVFHQLNNQ